MAQSFDRCENVMLGHAAANGCQPATHMALLLSKSLCKSKRFDPSDVMSRYLYLYYQSKCDMGKATRLVYEELTASLTTTSNTLTKKDFIFPMEKIHDASRSAHDKLKGLSGGCSPAQHSFPLALCPRIDDKTLFQLSCAEASLTHFSAVAGQIAGLVNLICRRLLKGDEWNDAIKTAFSTAPDLFGEIREIQDQYKQGPLLNRYRPLAYSPNTLNTSLYCITDADSFEDALKGANKIETHYCPTLVGIFAGARWLYHNQC
jgi:ADP-ribosylglycohydrolase